MTIFDLFKDQISSDILQKKPKIFTSLNRYERKKNINLAVEAFALSKVKQNAILVIAGGWDPRVTENVEHEAELRALAQKLGVQDRVAFLKSISNDHRLLLLEQSEALLYTPENEHFGIVPVEAMHARCIVFARKSGGPLESIEAGKTGFLLSEKP